jgi:hypothetical protein
LTFDLLERWDEGFEKLNQCKLGSKYALPWPFLELRMMHIVSCLPFPQTKGFPRQLSDDIPGIKFAARAEIWKRSANLDLRPQETISSSDEPIVIPIVRTGINMLFEILEWLCLMGQSSPLCEETRIGLSPLQQQAAERRSVKE